MCLIKLFEPKVSYFDRNKHQRLIRYYLAVYMRGLKAGREGLSFTNDVIFNGHRTFGNYELRYVYFAGLHDGNREKFLSKMKSAVGG